MSNNEDTISTLNHLIQICHDGHEGFSLASEGVDNNDLKNMFIEYSEQRANFLTELANLVVTLGGEPASSNSIKGQLHHVMLSIRTAVSSGEEEDVLEECDRGEEAAKDAYEKALEKDMPIDVREVVQRQYESIGESHSRIHHLAEVHD